MHTKLIVLACMFCTVSVSAQMSFPKNASEDKEHIMSEAYWKLWNDSVQQKIDADIDANRKADASIVLEGATTGTEVKVEQQTQAFLFGANIFNFNQLGKKEYNDRYKALFGTLFNSATIAFYWKPFEMQPNRPRFKEEYWDTEDFWNKTADPKVEPHWRRPAPDPVVAFCESKHIRLHGHTLVWGSRRWQNPNWIIDSLATPEERSKLATLVKSYANKQNHQSSDIFTEAYDKLTPAQLAGMFPGFGAKLQSIFDKRITEIANYYGSRLSSWDVVNESATDFQNGKMVPGDALCKSSYGLMPGDYTYTGFKTAAAVFPSNVKLNINEYNMSQAYVDQANDLRSRGAKIDIMGSQMHLFNPQQCLDIAAGKEIQSPKQVWETMNRISKAGLPIHLSEITITSPGKDDKGLKIQAVIAQNLYRLWFSVKPMMAITWWNIVDDCGAPGEPSVSGIFNRDMTPKPSYYALNNLINNEWKTNLTVKADKDGRVTFRGFKGKYLVSWKDAAGKSHIQEFVLN